MMLDGKRDNRIMIRLLLLCVSVIGFVFVFSDFAFAITEKMPLMERSGVLSVFYGAIMVVSFLLVVGYCVLVRKKEIWFILLFTSVLVVNSGYFLMSVSETLAEALWANRLSYFGSVFLPFFMLMIIKNVCHLETKRGMLIFSAVLGAVVFLLAASGGVLTWYYRDVSLATMDGISVLEKDYGPLHCVNLIYLLGYFAAMIAVIIQSVVTKKISSSKHAIILAVLVLFNIGVWYFEQLFRISFEFLSISYVLTELFLLLLYFMLEDFESRSLSAALLQKHEESDEASFAERNEDLSDPNVVWRILENSPSVAELTGREREVLQLMLENKKRKDIAEILCVSENTVKKHTSHIYTKMGVTCRKELYQKIKTE